MNKNRGKVISGCFSISKRPFSGSHVCFQGVGDHNRVLTIDWSVFFLRTNGTNELLGGQKSEKRHGTCISCRLFSKGTSNLSNAEKLYYKHSIWCSCPQVKVYI